MAFPEGNYGAELDNAVGPGAIISGITPVIVSFVAEGEIAFGSPVRAGTARGLVQQGGGGTAGDPS